MLVLTRRIDERIVLPTVGAAIRVVAAKPGHVRLGIEAPDNVPVFREEVLERLDPVERARLLAAAPGRLREQVKQLSSALSAAVMDLALLRRQLALWQREDLGVALDRIGWELKAAQQLAGTEPDDAVVAAPDFVVY